LSTVDRTLLREVGIAQPLVTSNQTTKRAEHLRANYFGPAHAGSYIGQASAPIHRTKDENWMSTAEERCGV
jgi:predicted RNase H-like nuclease